MASLARALFGPIFRNTKCFLTLAPDTGEEVIRYARSNGFAALFFPPEGGMCISSMNIARARWSDYKPRMRAKFEAEKAAG